MPLEPAPKSQEQIDAEISALVKRLNSRDQKVRRTALAILVEYGNPGIEALLTTLTDLKQRSNFIHDLGMIGTGVLWLFLFLHERLPFPHSLCVSLIFYFFYLSATEYLISTQKQAAELFSLLDNIRSIGFLVEVMTLCDAKTQRSVSKALVRLLPRLKETDAKLLSLKQRAILLDWFEWKQAKPELLFASLKGLEQVGGEESIPVITRVARGGALCRKFPGLKEAAQECLPYLQARAEGKELSDTLLRASHDTTGEQTLLRTSESATPEEPENELLRPM